MATNFDIYKYLFNNGQVIDMPAIKIKSRATDKFIEYNSKTTRVDRISNDVYGNPTYWRVIMWANPEYYVEYDIPDNTALRVPLPLDDVVQEIIEKVVNNKDV